MAGNEETFYHEPFYSYLLMSPTRQFPVELDSIPVLMHDKTSIPFEINLGAAPFSDLTVQLSSNDGITVSNVQFPAGTTKGTYTIAVSDTATKDTHYIEASLAGTDAAAYYLTRN